MAKNPKVTSEEVLELVRRQRLSNVEAARRLGVDESSVRRAVKRFDKEYGYLVDTVIAEQFREELEKPLIIEAYDESWAVTADWHSPLTDMELVNTFLTTCRRMNVKNLIINGDFFNGDALSKYMPKQANAGLEIELIHANYLMGKLLETFETIVFLKGNHDYRYVVGRDYSISFADAMRDAFSPLGDAVDRIVFTNLDHCYIESYSGRYYVCHPKSYSQIPGTTALKLSQKFNDCHIITGHSHHCAMMYTKDGERLAVEIGGFFDAEQTQYLQDSTTFPKWTNGFGILHCEDGFVLYPGNRRRSVCNQLRGVSSAVALP